MILAVLLAAAPVQVVHVHDGDTLTLASGTRVRLANIDAPELPGSPSCRREKRATHWCGDWRLAVRSRDALAAFLRAGDVRVLPTGRLSYGRVVARVTVDGRDAAAFLVRRGLARWWK